jgi:hypothetical protein
VFSQISDLVFDVDALQRATREVYGIVEPRDTRRGNNVLRAINLTHRPGASDPYHEGSVSRRLDTDAGAPRVREAEYSQFNRDFEKTYFYEVYRSVPFAVGRMRLISLPPSTIYRVHVDTSDRVHVAITTNPYTRLVSGAGETFHVPVDGGAYRIRTREEHTAYNAGPDERLHLVMSMSDTEN